MKAVRSVSEMFLVLLSAVMLHLLGKLTTADPLRDLHVDENLYMLWGQRIAVLDDWFLRGTGVIMDKPPLLPLILGTLFKVFGASPAVGFIPNQIFSIVTLVVVYFIGKELAGKVAGALSLVILSTSSFWIFYANSMFTDPGLVMMTSLAICAAIIGKPAAAGFLSMGSLWFKQFGLLSILLVFIIFVLFSVVKGRRWDILRDSLLFLCGIVFAFMPLFLWENLTRPRWGAFLRQAASPAMMGLAGRDWANHTLEWLSLLAKVPVTVWLWLGLPAFLMRWGESDFWGTIALLSVSITYIVGISFFSFPLFSRYILFVVPATVVVIAVGWSSLVRLSDKILGLARPITGMVLIIMVLFFRIGYSRIETNVCPETVRPGLRVFLESTCAIARSPVLLFVPKEIHWEFMNAAFARGFGAFALYGYTLKDFRRQVAGYGGRPRGFLVLGEDCESSRIFQDWRLETNAPLRFSGRAKDGRRTVCSLYILEGGRKILNPTWSGRFPAGDGIALANGIRLYGIDIRRSGKEVVLDSYWKAEKKVERDWLIFINLLDAEGKVFFEAGHEPLGGNVSTTRWPVGKTVRDRMTPVGEEVWRRMARVRVGMYEFMTGDKVKVVGSRRRYVEFEASIIRRKGK